jgi:hypothetical protein
LALHQQVTSKHWPVATAHRPQRQAPESTKHTCITHKQRRPSKVSSLATSSRPQILSPQLITPGKLCAPLAFGTRAARARARTSAGRSRLTSARAAVVCGRVVVRLVWSPGAWRARAAVPAPAGEGGSGRGPPPFAVGKRPGARGFRSRARPPRRPLPPPGRAVAAADSLSLGRFRRRGRHRSVADGARRR